MASSSPLSQVKHILSLLSFLASLQIVDSTFFSDDLSKFDLIPKFSSHPMLYFGDDDIGSLQKKAQTSHGSITADLEEAVRHIQSHPHLFPPDSNAEFSSAWNEVYGNNLPVLAFYFVLNGDSDLLSFITSYMTRMASYDRWQVAALPKDEVPIAHSLVGFATAYDMLHEHLNEDQRESYLDKILEVTKEMYECSYRRHWGHYYVQNHQATNVLSLLVGSLLSEIHAGNIETAAKWKSRAVILFERTMSLLEGIEDGSIDEGVGYVGYTLRSLTQYVFLARRHFGYDHSGHPWLRKHFDYLYLTILPGFGRTIGIADSPQAWFYGPESQLYFLDTYVLRDGRANWLAQKIKDNKISLMKENRPDAQRFTTLHIEFLFYDPDISPHAPPGHDGPEFHHFHDWGVATYRSGAISLGNSTFVSFKSAKIHGEYINNIANSIQDDTLNGWKAFNPGHEHPDQNSFTLWLDGQPIISDGLYGPKYPYLDNVLMFREAEPLKRHTKCTHPWVGQLGACKKWLEWHGREESYSHGEIIVALEKYGKLFIVGDAAGAYTDALGLRHVYRSMVLLQKDLLLVLDLVLLKDTSTVSHVSSYFNNFMHSFRTTRHTSHLSGFTMDFDQGYQTFWATTDGSSPTANITAYNYTSSDKPLRTSNVNITFPVTDHSISIVYVFSGRKVSIQEFGLFQKSNYIHVALGTESKKFRIDIALDPIHIDYEPLCVIREQNPPAVTEFHKGDPQTDSESDKQQEHSAPDIFRGDESRDVSGSEAPMFYLLGISCVIFMIIYIRRGRKLWQTSTINGLLFLGGFLLALSISYVWG